MSWLYKLYLQILKNLLTCLNITTVKLSKELKYNYTYMVIWTEIYHERIIQDK